MAETITSMFAQPFSLALPYTLIITDSHVSSPRTVVVNPTGTVWYRMYLAKTGETGATQDIPKEFIAYFVSIIGAIGGLWSASLRANGVVRITYAGTGTGIINFNPGIGNNALEIRTLLGMSGTSLSFVGAGSTQDGVYPPTHCIFSHWRESPQDWTPEFVGAAVSELPDGRVDYLGDGYQRFKRSFSLRGHPRTPTDATALSMASATAIYPDEVQATLWLAPTATPAGTALPWSIHQFVATSMGKELGFTFSEFQQHIAGTQTYYDTGSWTAKTLTSGIAVCRPPWIQLTDRVDLEVTKIGRETRA